MPAVKGEGVKTSNFMKVRPLFAMADEMPGKDLRELLKSFWTNCVLISALLNSALIGIAFDPPDGALETTALGRCLAFFIYFGTVASLVVCFMVWLSWSGLDLVPDHKVGDVCLLGSELRCF